MKHIALVLTGLFAFASIGADAPDVRDDPLFVRYGIDVPTPDEERAMTLDSQRWRRTVALAAAVYRAEVEAYVAAVEQARYDEQQRARVAAAVEHYSRPERSSPAVTAPVRTSSASGRCGGDLPPCSVMMRESGGDIRAENPSSSASGKWQFIDGTWNGYGGYAHASDAPEEVQDARAREVWAGGSGCGNWAPTDGCG